MPMPLTVDAREHGLVGDGTTNDQPAFAKLVDAVGAACAADGRPRTIHIPAGRYVMRDQPTLWRSGVSLIGAGRGATCFVLCNPGNPTTPVPLAWFTAAQHGAGPDNHLADITFAHFEVDGSGVRTERYDPLAKGIGLQYVLRGRFSDLYVHDAAATGFGCDFLQDTVVEGVLAVRCGRLDPGEEIGGEEMGGAGIGIGIGGWGGVERLTVTACTAIGNGTNGIFVELQRENWPPPRGIRITACHAEDNRYGISDWGADGLLVTSSTMLGNHEAGFDVSSQGTSGVGGRGGIVTGCVIDGNVRDGLGIGNTPGPYAFRGNRISNNGRYGYWEHNLTGGDQEPATDIVLESNDIRDNALDGVRIDAALRETAIAGNRIRNNGRRAAPATSGGGEGVHFTSLSMTDENADWPPDGHRGKQLTVGTQSAVVTFNTATELALAPAHPGAATAWSDGTPAAGSAYRLPDSPAVRAGLTTAAAVTGPHVHSNRVWDDQRRKTQTHGIWITHDGTWTGGRISDNDLTGNASTATRFDTPPTDCRGHGHDNDA
ncbi:right-handed parallel beta-helix repeat-containing protein [Streptomyces sp. HC44]|uniref:Right-handed parallel beta-helix repeat-containing protein n=1 Tax=Streptomyces scabichelini TaxID=2711217 RepID=A0A6G4V6Z4_9ACTN|nr:right-handed parallel beta-helix repeat-containing protein [Streptomyces scabichelini]NGO09862.1 right-handed parallel beta-helix repeat-containing protein [Streptomyces scabichelini]